MVKVLNRKVYFIFSLFLLIFFIGSNKALAQSAFDSLGVIGNTYSIKLIPAHPKPYEKYIAKIDNGGVPIYDHQINWIIKTDSSTLSKSGEKIELTAPKSGVIVSIEAIITTPSGKTFSTNTSINPGRLDLLIRGKTHTPKWYLGEALPSAESQIEIVAMPYFLSGQSPIEPSTVIYEWSINGKTRPDLSGYGKQKVTIPSAKVLGNTLVKVVARSERAGGMAEKITRISMNEPELILYEEDALSGTKSEKIIRSSITGKNISIRAVPFFFDQDLLADDKIERTWSVNGVGVVGQNDGWVMRVENRGTKGNIVLKVSSPRTLLQDKIATLSIQ